MREGEQQDKKSLRVITARNPDWGELAKDCVCFANAYGGHILIGIEDDEDEPASGQAVDPYLCGTIVRKVQERTVNVALEATVVDHANGGQYIDVAVRRTANQVASTTDGRYFIRVDDECKRLLPDDLLRLMTDKTAYTWEVQKTTIPHTAMDRAQVHEFLSGIRSSDRVKDHVKDMGNREVLEHYHFILDEHLTHLGVLWVGTQGERARLPNAPVVHFIKYDEQERKVRKVSWDDHARNPMQLLNAIWSEIPEWREGIEVGDGVFRRKVLHYEEVVIRELIANAVVHRPYTTRGDIFINLYPDRLEVHNPGLLPTGVTPRNILHKSEQRNAALARVFHDLKLMEREGSGYDAIYAALLSNGKVPPEVSEGQDRVVVTVRKRIVNEQVIRFLEEAGSSFSLRNREIITLGLLAQHNGLTGTELSAKLGFQDEVQLAGWLGRLVEYNLVKRSGRSKGGNYRVNPALLKMLAFDGPTTLRNIERHRLEELIRTDVMTYGPCGISHIHERIGKEIPRDQVQAAVRTLRKAGMKKTGGRRDAEYFFDQGLSTK